MVSAPLRDDALSSEQRWLCRASAAPSSLCLRLAALVSEVDVPWRDVVNPEASLDIWKVVRPLVPDTFEGCSLAGPHPQLRLLQYHGGTGEGDHPVHADTPLAAPDSYSRLTALVYVNSGFAGGSLRFLDGADGADVDPKEGTVVVFDHRLLHQARAVVSGTKQVVKMSVLYEAEPEAPLRQTLAGADLEVRWPFVLAERALARGARVASEALCDFIERPSLVERTFAFVGTKRQELQRLVAAAGRHPADNGLLEELLDFILAYDTEQLHDVLNSAFMPMAVALNNPSLKLKAYRAWEAARSLHGDEKCVLLGETLLKDIADPNPQVRLACVGAYFSLIPNDNEDLRSDAIKKVLAGEEDPAVRRRALQGVADLVSSVKAREVEQAEEAEDAHALQRLSVLWESYAETLTKISVSSSPDPLAIRALAELSAMRQDMPLE